MGHQGTKRNGRRPPARWGVLLAALLLGLGVLGSCATEPMPEQEGGGAEEGDVFPPEQEERHPWQQETRLAWSAPGKVTH